MTASLARPVAPSIISRALLALLAALTLLTLWAAAGAAPASAHHGTAGESAQQAKARDATHVRICDQFRYQGATPPKASCVALLRGAHANRGIPRAWVSSPATLRLLFHESGWRPAAVNPYPCAAGGHARGMFQFCDQTWLSYGCATWRGRWTSAVYQATCGWRYIRDRYGNPKRAWAFWLCPRNPTGQRCSGAHWY